MAKLSTAILEMKSLLFCPFIPEKINTASLFSVSSAVESLGE